MAKRSKLSYSELESKLRQTEQDRHLFSCGLQALMAGEVKWFRRGVPEPDCKANTYDFGVTRLTGTNGGMMLITHRNKLTGQAPYTVVHLLDDLVEADRSNLGTIWHQVSSPAIAEAVRLRSKAIADAMAMHSAGKCKDAESCVCVHPPEVTK